MNGQLMGRPTPIALLAVYSAVVGAVSFVLGATDALDGQSPAIGRTIIGVVGLIGGGLLWTQPQRGGLLCLAWAVAQIPYIVWNLDGSLTTQLIEIPLSMSSTTSRNGVITEQSAFGINLVGVALTILAVKVRSLLVVDAMRDEARRSDESPSADRTLREIEALRQAGTITREEANERRQAVLQSLSKPAETPSDSSPGSRSP
jgi:hypothetical protein